VTMRVRRRFESPAPPWLWFSWSEFGRCSSSWLGEASAERTIDSTSRSSASTRCSRQTSPLSLRKTIISRSLPRNEAKWGTSMSTGPRNLAPAGPTSMILEAHASPSISGGGWMRRSRRRYLQVMRMGIWALFGGMMTRTPEWRQPRIAPPRASTMKLTRNLGFVAFPFPFWPSFEPV